MSRHAYGGSVTGLTQVQRRFLGRCRREPKPLVVLLRESQVSVEAFARWRGEEVFEREFRRVGAGLTRDALSDLRFTFAMCGRIISAEVAKAQEEGKKGRVKKGKKGAATAPAPAEPQRQEKQEKQEKQEGTAVAEQGGDGGLEPAMYRLCFDVIKVGMGAFVRKGRGRKKKGEAFPEVDPEAFARLERAQEGEDPGIAIPGLGGDEGALVRETASVVGGESAKG